MRCLFKPAGSPLAMVLLFVAGTYPLAAIGHEITIFAQRGDVFHGRTITNISFEEALFSINNQREIAFMARVEEGAAYVVMTQNRFVAGGGQVVDGVVPRFQEEDNDVWINDLGQVAYSGTIAGGSGGDAVFLDDELLFRSGDMMAGRVGSYFVSDSPVVDRFGTTAFRVLFNDPNAFAVATQHGIVAESGDVIDDFTLEVLFRPSINSDGRIAFAATTTDSSFVSVFTSDQRLIGPGDVISGIPVTRLLDVGNINSEGTITATIVSGTFPDAQTYAVADDEVLVGTGSIVAGLEIENVLEAKMTSDGLLVFVGSVVSDDGVLARHLFAGDELLFSVGDEVDGHTILGFSAGFQINELGDVVVEASLSDIHRALLLITVPEPSTMSMLCFGALWMLLFGRATRAGRRG